MLHFALCMSMFVCLEIKIFVFVFVFVLHFRPDKCFIKVHEWFGIKVPKVPVYQP